MMVEFSPRWSDYIQEHFVKCYLYVSSANKRIFLTEIIGKRMSMQAPPQTNIDV